jgi:hypothetical protein
MAVQQRASGILARFQSLVDKMISPDTRSEYYSKIIAFAQDTFNPRCKDAFVD